MLQLSQLGIALLLQNFLGVGGLRLGLADLLVEAAHAGGTQLCELEGLIQGLPLTLLHLLLVNIVIVGCC